MIKRTVICDRCGAEITEDHPTRIQVQEYDYSESKTYGKSAVGYKTTSTLHLCKKCEDEFKNHMGMKP